MGDTGLLIWAPVAVDELRTVLHKAGYGWAVLVAVESGTVVVPSERMGPSIAVSWAYLIRRKFGRTPVVLAWDDEATMILPVPGPMSLGWEWGGDQAVRHLFARLAQYGPVRATALAVISKFTTSKRGPAKQRRAASRIAKAFGINVDSVADRLADFETQVAPDQLMTEWGQPDVARVVRLINVGSFDRWRTERSWMIERQNTILVVAGVAVLFPIVTLPFGILLPLPVVMVALLLAFVVPLSWIRYRVSRQPIESVLPVVSDNQSAK